MEITAIQKRRKLLSALFLDGEFAALIDTETLLKFGYKTGMHLTDEQLHELILASQQRRAHEKALYLLEFRSHSKRELTEKIARTTSREAAQAAAERMEELGLLNDEEYARRYAADLLSKKGYAEKRICYELQKKGIDRALAQQALDELEMDPTEQIRRVIEKKYVRYLHDEKGCRRAVSGLQRMGYRYEDIKRAMAEFTQALRNEFEESV